MPINFPHLHATLTTRADAQKKKKIVYLCGICGECFSRKKALTNHVTSCHLSKLIFECNLCPRKFSTEIEKAAHMRTHVAPASGGFECTYIGCKRVSAFHGDLKVHLLAHKKRIAHMSQETLETPGDLSCLHVGCEQRFKNSAKLKQHTMTHSESLKQVDPQVNLNLDKAEGPDDTRKLPSARPSFACNVPGCSFSSKVKNYLRNHKRYAHCNSQQ
jgi:uncharacterized Zn-finger protein